MLLYNVDFEIVALVFVCVIYIFHRVQYCTESALNKQFSFIVKSGILFIVTDIVSAVGISFYSYIPYWFNCLLNTSNFCALVLVAHEFSVYITTLTHRSDTLVRPLFNRVLCIIYMVLALVNIFAGFLFYFDETGYVHGPLYLVSAATGYYYVVYGAVLIFKYRKELTLKQVVSTASYVILMLIAAVVQIFVLPNVLFSGVAIAITLVIILFSLETPDFIKLNETMEELENARVKAEKANAAKSEFLANMSHEIRTPLNGILGTNEILMKENKDEELNHYFKDIKEAGNSLLTIINDILDTSKIESGKLELVCENYETEELLRNCHNLVKKRAEDKGLKLDFKIDSGIPRVLYGDEIRIRQVITNILTNAVKYTESGSVLLTAFSEDLGDDTVNLNISVKDTGIGIKEEDLSKLFKTFERLDLSRNRTIEGTGLGLHLVRDLVSLMDGNVSVKSTYGEGSEFSVVIPQKVIDRTGIGAFNVEENDNSITTEELPELREANILVVDDVRMNLKVIQGLLKDTPLKLSLSTSGEGSIAMCRDKAFDMILMDHMMPEMDGVEAMEHIKKECPLNFETPIIVFTANAISGVKEEYLSKGFVDYISKPVTRENLYNTIYKYLS